MGHRDRQNRDSPDGRRCTRLDSSGSRESIWRRIWRAFADPLRRLGEARECEGPHGGRRDRWGSGGRRKPGSQIVRGDRQILTGELPSARLSLASGVNQPVCYNLSCSPAEVVELADTPSKLITLTFSSSEQSIK